MVGIPRQRAVPVTFPKRGTRLSVAAALAVAAYAVSGLLPRETRLVLALDVGAIVYLLLMAKAMSAASAEQCRLLATESEPSGGLAVASVSAIIAASICAVVVMLDPAHGWPAWLTSLHQGMSIVAVALSWLLFNAFFGLYYMKLYYDDVVEGEPAYRGGLEFPNKANADAWDFMYYSFTIAMCYQTSDVTICDTRMRRATLIHAVLSFFFVVLILGLVVNVLSNLV